MTQDEARAALVAAGADDMRFMDSLGYTTGIKVSAGDRVKALRWREEVDGTLSAVGILKEWLAANARAR